MTTMFSLITATVEHCMFNLGKKNSLQSLLLVAKVKGEKLIMENLKKKKYYSQAVLFCSPSL